MRVRVRVRVRVMVRVWSGEQGWGLDGVVGEGTASGMAT